MGFDDRDGCGMAKKHHGERDATSGLSTQFSGGARQSEMIASEEEHRQFVESLRRRGQAAEALQNDLLTEVPLLYGTPGSLEARGDPGIILAEIHREELVRRNGGGVAKRAEGRDTLPFEDTTMAIALALGLVLLFSS
jgi:hypothetical protein